MKRILVAVIAVMFLIAVGAVQAVQAMPMMTSLAEQDTTLQLVWVANGAGVETPVTMLNDSTVIFEPVLYIQPIGLRWNVPKTPIGYVGISTLVTANSTGVMPHLGGVIHAGPYISMGVTWTGAETYYYLASEELVRTIFNWIGKGGAAVVRKL